MSYLVLARKYRPQTFSDVVRQEHVTRTLANAITSGRVAHAILFSGPRGTGKTTIARILAKAMNCQEGPTPAPCNVCTSCKEITGGGSADVFEIDGASNNGVDHIRDLRENIKYMPSRSRYKIYIIDEVHMLSTPAFNALLKTLEEPPAHILFFFATTEPHKIPITILSRCQRHDLRRIELKDIFNHLETLCQKESVEIDRESLGIITRESGGSMRDALSLLDQVMSASGDGITHEKVLELLGVVDRKILFDVSRAVISGDISGGLELLDDIYDHGHDIKEFHHALTEHFRDLLVVRMGAQTGRMDRKRMEKLVDAPGREIEQMAALVKDAPDTWLSQIFNTLLKAETEIRYAGRPRLAMEMLLIRLSQIRPALPIDQLLDRLDKLNRGIYEAHPHQTTSMPSPRPNMPSMDLPGNPASNPGIPRTGLSEIPPSFSSAAPDNRQIPPPPRTAEAPEAVQADVMENRMTDADDATARNPIHDPADSPEQTWRKLTELISGQSASLGACLSRCQLLSVGDAEIEIASDGNGFDLKRITRHLDLIRRTCSDFFGREMTPDIRAADSPKPDPRQKKETANRLQQEALNHPLVQAALEIFDGKIEYVNILKEE